MSFGGISLISNISGSTATPGTRGIADSFNNLWTVTGTGSVVLNKTVMLSTSGVSTLLWYNNGLYYSTTNGVWYRYNYGALAWNWYIGDPRIPRVWTPIDSSFSLVMDDEFNGVSGGTGFDTNVWGAFNGPTLGQDSPAASGTANLQVLNGFLKLAITASGTLYTGAGLFQWLNNSFSNGWTNGYFESRIKMPGPTFPTTTIKGSTPTIWMNNLDSFPENDIAGASGLNGKIFSQSYMNPDNTGGFGFSNGGAAIGVNGDPSLAFHVYGMLWANTSITFYVDGQQTWQIFDGVLYSIGNGTKQIWTTPTNVPQYLIIWNMINYNAAGTPDGNSVFPYNMYIDYVHVYQQNPAYAVATPQANYGGPGDSQGSGNSPGF